MSNINIIQANSLHIPLRDKSAHMAVTSCPYWALRTYRGTASWVGGDPACDHEAARKKTRFDYDFSSFQATNPGSDLRIYGDHCPACDATRIDNQLGSESLHDCLGWATGQPCGECFVCHVRQWAAEVWRVLRDDGTFWLNLGDSYVSSPTGSQPGLQYKQFESAGAGHFDKTKIQGLKPKDLVGIPWRVALALQADGWYLRSEIIWHKRAPMPESVTDRPTKSHEQIFLLTKSARYFYDAIAVQEDSNPAHFGRYKYDFGGAGTKEAHGSGRPNDAANTPGAKPAYLTRNLRDVWTLSPEGYTGQHFATFPTEIPRRAIKAGTSEAGCCPKCGAQWVRVVEQKGLIIPAGRGTSTVGAKYTDDDQSGWSNDNFKPGAIPNRITTGWRPSCSCNAGDPIPCTVLDPFNGAATTGLVCQELNRNYIGLELSGEYIQQSRARLGKVALEAWTNGGAKDATNDGYHDLPLFSDRGEEYP